jgi:serine protease Do
MTFSSSARRAVSVPALVLTFALGACSGDTRAQQPPPTAAAPASLAATAAQVTASSPSLVTGLPNFSPLVERVGPAVVNVDVVQTAGNDEEGGNDLNDFFRHFGIPEGGRGGPGAPGGRGFQFQPQPQRGSGSGFIVTPDGYILTNAHVVSDAEQVTVKLTDRREYLATVVGVDERTDVALIKIDAKNLPVARMGDPSKLKPGEWVLAIGSPFGFENSVTAGVISGTSRPLPNGDSTYVPFIQTDVAVNPGNSGGPLFNLQGEVVGINSQIYSRTGGYMGLSFAIPIDVALDVRDQLVKTGHVTRGRIGVQIQPVTGQTAEAFGLDRPRGALVNLVVKDGPSSKAGVKQGDIILDVNGRVIETSDELPTVVARIKPGDTARLSVLRGGKEQKIDVKVEALDQPEVHNASFRKSGEDRASRLGLSVRPLTPQEKAGVETEGTLVVERATGPAAIAGIQRGDIILGVNGAPVKSGTELQTAAKSGKTVALLVQNPNGTTQYITVRPAEPKD